MVIKTEGELNWYTSESGQGGLSAVVPRTAVSSTECSENNDYHCQMAFFN